MKAPRPLVRLAVLLSLLAVESLPGARAAEKIYEVRGAVVRPEKVSGGGHREELMKALNATRTLGVLIVQTVIRSDGTVGKVEILRPRKVPPEVGAVLRRDIESWRFKPATLDGRPVAVHYTLTLNVCPQ